MVRRTIHRRKFRAIVLWTIFGVAVMQIAIGTLIDVALPAVRDPEFTARQELLRERLAVEAGKPLVVMLGSSRTQLGVDAQAAMNALDHRALVFNFGIPASGPFLENIWLERLRATEIKPDVLFIEVIPAHYKLMPISADMRGLDGARLSARELAQIQLSLDSLRRPIWRWAVGRALPSYRHRAELYGSLGIDKNTGNRDSQNARKVMDGYGWLAAMPAPDMFPALKKMAHAQYDHLYRDFTLSSDQATILQKIIVDCRRDGILPVVLLTPEGSEFREQYSLEMSAAIDGMLAELRERFHVQVVDARDWVSDGHFYDMHHLLPEGAHLFADRLAREAIAPLLRAREAAAAHAAAIKGRGQ